MVQDNLQREGDIFLLGAAALPFGPVTTAEACSWTPVENGAGLLEGAKAATLPQETTRARVESENFMVVVAACPSFYPNACLSENVLLLMHGIIARDINIRPRG